MTSCDENTLNAEALTALRAENEQLKTTNQRLLEQLQATQQALAMDNLKLNAIALLLRP